MDDIWEMERRIIAALERIGAGVERQVSAPVSAAPLSTIEIDRLREELDEERMANAQLNERLRLQRERSDHVTAELRAEAARLTAQVDHQALAMQRMATSTIQMREELRRLRAGLEAEGQVAPGQIDRAMAAELEALRASREAETAELANIVAALEPIVAAEEARTHA